MNIFDVQLCYIVGGYMTSYSDEQLMISVVEEDDLKAFEELIIRYEKKLLVYIFRHIRDFHMVQDLFQETFYRIYKNRKSFNPNLRFSPWVYRIATNLYINELKKKTHELEVSLEDTTLSQEPFCKSRQIVINRVPSNPSPEESVIKKDVEEKIGDLIMSLPEKIKTVFILSEYEGFTYREIANILEVPLGTVQSRLHSSFKHLSKLLKKGRLVDELR